MEKKVEVDYKGKKVFAIVQNDGSCFIELPYRKNSDGKDFYEYIVRDTLPSKIFGKEMQGWRFTSLRMYDENFRFNFWILDDGTMICNDSVSRPYRMLEKKFDPLATPTSKSETLAKEIYETIKQVKDHEYETVSMIGDVRKRRLQTALRLLGYDDASDVSFPLEEGKSYLSLRRIGSILEDYRNLSYVRKTVTPNGVENFVVDRERIPRTTHWRDGAVITDQIVSNDVHYMQEMDDLIAEIRTVPGGENYFLGIREDMEKKDPTGYHAYAGVVRRAAELLIGLNPDLVDEETLSGIRLESLILPGKQLTELQGMELADEIAELIDSEEFAKACTFEDKWVIEQCDKAEEILENDEKVEQSTALMNTLIGLVRKVQVSRDERRDAVRQYNFYRNIFEEQYERNQDGENTPDGQEQDSSEEEERL